MTAPDDQLETSFIEAIYKDPDDDEARAVYADWLEERGDPRGEYLRLEIQMHRNPLRMAALASTITPTWIEAVGRRYDVFLTAAGPNKINVIKLTRLVTGMGLKDAKDLVESTKPARLAENLERKAAEQMVREFDNSGATVAIEAHSRLPAAAVYGYVSDLVLVGGIEPNRKIDAIKALRQATELGLREARDAIESAAAGARFVVAHGIDPARAEELAATFRGLANVAIERSYGR